MGGEEGDGATLCANSFGELWLYTGHGSTTRTHALRRPPCTRAGLPTSRAPMHTITQTHTQYRNTLFDECTAPGPMHTVASPPTLTPNPALI